MPNLIDREKWNEGMARLRASIKQGYDLERESEIGLVVTQERERCLQAVAMVRSYYPEDVFPADGQTIDARAAAFARRLCDMIRDAICAVDFENERSA